MKKYVIHGDHVISRYDGQHHFVSASKLINLYRVDPRECIIYEEGCLRGYTPEFIDTLIHLYPDHQGVYEKPESCYATFYETELELAPLDDEHIIIYD